jgi:putative MATE family efflux protein
MSEVGGDKTERFGFCNPAALDPFRVPTIDFGLVTVHSRGRGAAPLRFRRLRYIYKQGVLCWSMATVSAQRSAAARPRLNLTQWSSPRELARIVLILSLPVAATNALQTLLSFVDTRMVSSLGEAALPALGAGRTLMFFVSSIFMGLGVGITAYVARLAGAGDHERARQYATVGVIFSGGIGLLMMLLGLLVAEGPVKALVTSQGGGVDPATAELTRKYAWDFMRIMFISLGGVGVQFAVVNIFNSLGRTVFPMWLLVLNNIANLIGNILLIPRYEVAGSAMATLSTTVLATIVGVVVLQRQGAIRLDLGALSDAPRLRAAFTRGWEMLRIGAPSALQVMARSMSMLLLLKLITYLPNSVIGQSALQVGLQVESLAFMPAFAFSTAAATLVGQNLGARSAERARQSTWFCLIGSQVVMGVLGLVQVIWPEFFIRLFIGNNAPEVVQPAATYIRVLGACLPGLGLSLTMMGALRGAGDTKVPAWISIAAMYIVRIPLAIYLSFETFGGMSLFGGALRVPVMQGLGWGLPGIWWSMTISVYVEAFMAWLRFRGGAWARVQLDPDHEKAIAGRLAGDSDAELERDVEVLEAEHPAGVVVPTEPLQNVSTPQQPQTCTKPGGLEPAAGAVKPADTPQA